MLQQQSLPARINQLKEVYQHLEELHIRVETPSRKIERHKDCILQPESGLKGSFRELQQAREEMIKTLQEELEAHGKAQKLEQEIQNLLDAEDNEGEPYGSGAIVAQGWASD